MTHPDEGVLLPPSAGSLLDPPPACCGQVYLEDATPSYGGDTLEAFFRKAVTEGLKGQELGDQAVFGVNEQ